MNHPDRIAAWLVDEENGQKAMDVQDDIKLEGSIRVLLNAQDHTLGNMLRSQLLLDKNVLFAGYRIPHPLTNQVELRIQTDKNMEPYVSPRKALLNACAALMNQTRDLKASFIEQVRVAEMGLGPAVAAGSGPALTSGGGAVGAGIGAPYDEVHTWGGGMSGVNAAGGTIGAGGSGAPGVRGSVSGTGNHASMDEAYEY